MAKKMLIDATHAEETRVVVVDGNKVEEFDFESENKRQLAGNIYLAKVTRVEPSLQAAFVDYGGNRHGFLAFSEIHPDYYQIPVADREALMEEERAYAEAMRARDEDEEEKPAKPKRSRRSKSSAKAAKASSKDAVETKEVEATEPAAGEIAGMETIDLTDSTEAADVPAELAEVPEGSSPMERVVETPVEEPEEGEAAEAAPAAEAEEPAAAAAETAEDVPAEDATAEASDESGSETEAETASADAETSAEAAKGAADSEEDGDDDGETSRADATSKDESIESVADEDDSEDIRPPRKPRPRRYKIQEVIKVRQVLLVQVVKEERGNKGAALTTYLSLAGRYCVLMPNTARGGGISRKITNAADRKKLKDIATELDVPTGAGLIVRTAGAKRTKSEIKRDYEYLQRLWEQIRELTLKSIAPAKIYEEGDLIKRSIRDLYSREIDEVLVEGDRGYRIAKDFMKMIMPSHAKNVKHYQDGLPLFARFQVESYLAGMFNPTVQLKSGGYIVIGVTEALVAIDVNSGRATKEGSIEETALKTNLEAAEEVARQLRLRDLAGLIVIDFIDMDERKNNAAVEKRMKDKLKTDRARIQVGRISGFGLMEMSRQRLRPGMIEATTAPCPHCHGTGLIRSDDSMALSILRQIEEEGTRRRSREVLVRCPVSIANFLMNQKREHIAQIEARYGLSVRIEGDAHLVSPDFVLEKFKTASRTVPAATAPVVSVDTSIMDQVDAEETKQDEEESAAVSEAEAPEDTSQDDKPKRKRRRRRRRKGGNGEQSQNGETGETGEEASEDQEQPKEEAAEASEAAAEGEEAPAEEVKEKKRSRTRTRSRKPKAKPAEAEATAGEESAADAAEAPTEAAEDAVAAVETAGAGEAAAQEAEAPVAETAEEAPAEAEAAPAEEAAAEAEEAAAETVGDTPEEAVSEEAEAEPAAEEPVAEEPAAEEAVTEETEAAEPAPAVEEKQPEPAMAGAEAAPEPASPPKPKRRGWWSMGS
ncbi:MULTISPECIES: Rne/Rng family ribonuclease [unclassified Leisingera]|uniref:Rne/Rng family ribonuclease n=1 Tax=unclassified Leisingera TaxID=2614906 RepID=UPI00037F372D|nr:MULTISPECIES: ribonuclease E/G [unclassified Leisingera]KIC26576.1 ribonuclease [Leisingera sp. ANG-S3]KIC53804.1 ribonuclease [Leisingera sp. ANG-S]KID10292.1 ribonuclease [Leisingera sp. ANG1]